MKKMSWLRKVICLILCVIMASELGGTQKIMASNKETLYCYMDVKTNKYGLINGKGKVVVKPTYDWINEFSDGMALVSKGNKYGYVDEKGKEVIKVSYKEANDFSDGLALIRDGKKYKYIDKSGKVLINVKGKYPSSFSEGYASLEINGKWGGYRQNRKGCN